MGEKNEEGRRGNRLKLEERKKRRTRNEIRDEDKEEEMGRETNMKRKQN